jgi:hypothetical protein
MHLVESESVLHSFDHNWLVHFEPAKPGLSFEQSFEALANEEALAKENRFVVYIRVYSRPFVVGIAIRAYSRSDSSVHSRSILGG